MKWLFRRHTIADLQSDARTDQRLHRVLGPVNLAALGVVAAERLIEADERTG